VARRIERQWVGESILCVTQLCRAVHFENGGGDRGGMGEKGVGRSNVYEVWNRPPHLPTHQTAKSATYRVTPQSR